MSIKPFNAYDHALADLSKRNLHHRLFKHIPELLALSSINGNDMLEPFLAHAIECGLSMNWTLHIHFLNWLMQQKEWYPMMNADRIKSLLIAAVIRWSLAGLDHVTAKGVMVVSKHLPDKAVGIWKSAAPHRSSKIVSMPLPEKHQLDDGYAVFDEYGVREPLKWMALPL